MTQSLKFKSYSSYSLNLLMSFKVALQKKGKAVFRNLIFLVTLQHKKRTSDPTYDLSLGLV